MRTALFTLACLLLALPVSAEQRETLVDFDREDAAQAFTPAVGKLRIAREKTSEGAPEVGPKGFALALEAEGPAAIVGAAGSAPKDLLNASDVELWIYRPAEEAKRGKATIEVEFLEEDQQARFWTKLELDHAGWKKHSLPLRWFRFGEGRIPRWSKVDRWGLVFRDAAAVQVDDVAVVRQDDPDAALPQTDDYARLAFPAAKPSSLQTYDKDGLRILSDAPKLDADELAAHFQKVRAAIEVDFGKRDASAWPATLLIFQTRADYAEFFPRFGERYQAQLAAPKSDGFSTLAISISSWSDEHGTLRPVYTHEFVHCELSRRCGLPNAGDWLQEGSASMYQLRFHPQKNFAEIVRAGLADPARHDPLEKLASGQRLSLQRYWQAATLCELLATSDKYKAKFPALVTAFSQSGSTNLDAQREKILGVTWEELTADWKTFCTEKYAE